MRIYGISGLGADERVFKYLALDCEFVYIDWIELKRNETIEEYAFRLSKNIDTQEKFGILGVSFGGLIAVEISKRLNPDLTILVSSAETRNELRYLYRVIGKLKFVHLLNKNLFNPPRFFANWLFDTKNKKLLNEILDDADLTFTKWAVNELIGWRNEKRLSNPVLKIEGTRDKLILPSKDCNAIKIQGGGHFMIVDRADEISRAINDRMSKKN